MQPISVHPEICHITVFTQVWTFMCYDCDPDLSQAERIFETNYACSYESQPFWSKHTQHAIETVVPHSTEHLQQLAFLEVAWQVFTTNGSDKNYGIQSCSTSLSTVRHCLDSPQHRLDTRCKIPSQHLCH